MVNKVFVITPNGGLCNQLISIINGILLGQKYNRNIYISRFLKNIYSNATCDINEVLDLDKFNIILEEYGIKIKLLKTFDFEKNKISCLKYINYNEIPRLHKIIDIIEMPENMDMNFIDINNVVSLCMWQNFGYKWNDTTNLYHILMSKVTFHEKFIKIKENIKQNLELTNYNCVHLRIEDDAINYFGKLIDTIPEKYNEILLNRYHEVFEQFNKDTKTYIATGMSFFENNINNEYYKKLMNKNKNLIDKQNINIENEFCINREFLAIIDFLLAQDSEIFVGIYSSSFSLIIDKCHQIKNKKSELIIL